MAIGERIDLSILKESNKLFPSKFYKNFFVNEYGKLEAIRASRYGRSFSIILVRIEDSIKNVNDNLGRDDILDFLKGVISAVMGVVRKCDVVGMVHAKQLIIILPETDYLGSLNALRKLRKTLSNIMLKGNHVSMTFSQATFPRDANGYGELVSVAEKKMLEQKDSLIEKLSLEQKLFWENIAILLNEDVESTEIAHFDLGDEQDYDLTFREKLIEMVTKEVSRTPKKRGIFHIGLGNLTLDDSLIKILKNGGEGMTNTFIIMNGDSEQKWRLAHVTPIFVADNRFKEVFFLLLLREDMAYAVISKESWGGRLSCVHTVDPYLVGCLIKKLQYDYSLQEQL